MEAGLLDAGDCVTVIDGLLPRTGGRAENLQEVADQVKFICNKVEAVKNLSDFIHDNDIVVDSMGWTAHNAAFKNKLYDAQLNCLSHLHVISNLSCSAPPKIIYLGTRVQYGQPQESIVTESTPMDPVDVQGIHKVAGESYYRVFSKREGFSAISLRVSNCFGENQPKMGSDIGLVGGFIRDLIKGKQVDVYTGRRQRNLAYVANLAELVFQLSRKEWSGFRAFNYAGSVFFVEDLVKAIIQHAGSGSYVLRRIPESIAKSEMGNVKYSDAALISFIGRIKDTPFDEALARTVKYFRRDD